MPALFEWMHSHTLNHLVYAFWTWIWAKKGFRICCEHFLQFLGRGLCHASAWVTRSRHLGLFLATRSRQSRVRVVCVLLMSRGRVSHAVGSLHLRFWHAIASSMRSCEYQFPSKLRFAFSFHFCMFSFPSFKSFCLRKPETTQHTNHGIEWK